MTRTESTCATVPCVSLTGAQPPNAIRTWGIVDGDVSHDVYANGTCWRCGRWFDLGRLVLREPYPENYDPREPYRRAKDIIDAMMAQPLAPFDPENA